MGLAAKSRAGVLDALDALLDSSTKASPSDWFSVEDGPQGRAHGYYAISDWRATGEGSREQTDSNPHMRYRVSIRYAHRVKVHDRQQSRRDALDALDSLHRACVATESGLELHYAGEAERLSPSREWLIYDLQIEARCLFDLGVAA